MTDSEDKMEVKDSDLEALKATAREVVEKETLHKNGGNEGSESDQNGVSENGGEDKKGEQSDENGGVNGESNGSDHAASDNEGNSEDQNGDNDSENGGDQNGNEEVKDGSEEGSPIEEVADDDEQADKDDDQDVLEDDNDDVVENGEDKSGQSSPMIVEEEQDPLEQLDNNDVIDCDEPEVKTPAKVSKDDSLDDSAPLRRSSRKKTPKKYSELTEKDLRRVEKEEDMEVEEIKDDDSDIQEVTPDDQEIGSILGVRSGSVSITKTSKGAGDKKPNVVTIDDPKTLQRLATSAKKSVDEQHKRDSLTVIDTQSLLAGKMGSGVSITPARPRSGVMTPSGLNISSAGFTLGSGVTIRPNSASNSANNSPSTLMTKLPNNSSVTISGGSASSTPGLLSQRSPNVQTVELADPNLTDDTFVVEAPSFIVPYVYEKPPKEPIKEFNSSVKKLQKDLEAKEEKEKAEAKKKRREERQKKRDDGEEVEDDTDEEEDQDKENDKEKEKDKENKDKKDEEETDIKIVGEVKEEKKNEKKEDPYFNSTLGKFFIELGMNFVQEYVQTDLLRQQQKRAQKDKSAAVLHAINSLQKNLDDSRDQNEHFHLSQKKCRFCSFRTESKVVMGHHLETPHMRNFVYRCNFCDYETRLPHEVLHHMDVKHGIKGRLERAPYFHQCPQCPFEDNGKGKLTRHRVGCDKRFKAELNQIPDRDWDAPAKIKPQPVRPGYSSPYGNAKGGGMIIGGAGGGIYAMGSAGVMKGAQGQMIGRNMAYAQGMNPRFQGGGMAGGNRGGYAPRGRPVGSYKGNPDLRIPSPSMLANQVSQQQQKQLRGLSPMLSGQQMLALLNHQGLSVSQTQRNVVTGRASTSPSISITPLPGKGSGSKAKSPAVNAGIKPGASPGNKGNFVICEICDGYIKDLEQLRNHMQWIHKVKIHPKMIYNRPPLNCQKCQFRFFTDQGLERHLLGSHGLVTASMQDAANKGQDSGRCPVCGKVYQWKLLNHVAKDHGKTLKPAHLSYKCTVCTATFGQYKLFETHVYTAHSGATKRTDKTKQVAKPGPSGSSPAVKTAVKLSNEISIVKKDAPAKVTENEVINLDDEEEVEAVEKETKSKKEIVVDLADSPVKKKAEASSSKKRDLDEAESSGSKAKKAKSDEDDE